LQDTRAIHQAHAMKKYLVLYRSPVHAADQIAHATPEQQQAGFDEWTAWAHRAGSAVVDLGNPVGHPHYFSGTPSKGVSHLGGFSILQADDEGELRILLVGHPHLQIPGASIEAHEFLPMPGA
jgi:hypothetical protein